MVHLWWGHKVHVWGGALMPSDPNQTEGGMAERGGFCFPRNVLGPCLGLWPPR